MSRRLKIQELRDQINVLKGRRSRIVGELEKAVGIGVKIKLGVGAFVAIGGFASSIATDGIGLALGTVSVVLSGYELWSIPLTIRKLKRELDDLEREIMRKQGVLNSIK